jgi:hypothetical protein
MPGHMRLQTIAVAVASASCAGGRDSAQAPACEHKATDSARAACVAVDAASRRAGRAQRVHEFRTVPAGYSILTVPVEVRRTDGDLTVHVSRTFEVTGFGPDSA